YAIAVEKNEISVPVGFEVIHIPAQTYAVFDAYGPMPPTHWNMIKRIYGEWFPSTGYEHTGTPDIEVYPASDGEGDNWPCFIWVPVKKANEKTGKSLI
ncbi:MAG: hypothetical protein GY850_28550, partial [bacterium]|nr:hypothetical protein [bacterium]